MARDRVIASVDVGATKTTALVGGITRDGKTEIIGLGVAPSRGIKRGMVVDIDAAATSIVAAVEKAEKSSAYQIASAVVGISGEHMASSNNRGVIAVNQSNRIIEPDDVSRVIEAARTIAIPSDREIIGTVPRSYTLDNNGGVKNPVGMHGFRLEVETHIITGSMAAVQNLNQCIGRVGLQIDEIVFQGLASAEAVLTEEEKDMGVLLVDIGGGSTDVAIFVDGSVWHSSSIPVGGSHITNDLAIFTRAPVAIAEDLKLSYGSAVARLVDPYEVAEVQGENEGEKMNVSRREICDVIEARIEDILNMVVADVKRSGFDGLLPGGLVITGGTANLRGIDMFARDMLGLPVRIGKPKGLRGLTERLADPAYSTSVGLLIWGLKFGDVDLRAGNGRGRKSGGNSLWGRLRGLGRDLLPQ